MWSRKIFTDIWAGVCLSISPTLYFASAVVPRIKISPHTSVLTKITLFAKVSAGLEGESEIWIIIVLPVPTPPQ